MKIVTVIGARPQFIKAAVVSRVFKEQNAGEEIIIHTGQHFDDNMSRVFFEQMNIPEPDYNLDINGKGHGEMTGKMLAGIEKILVEKQPDLVLVYGDTNSTLAGALAAAKLHIPVAHVEAGLRSFNMEMPEEINRVLTDRISSYLYCPTQVAVDNLKKEGYEHLDGEIIFTGDVMQDAAYYYAEKGLEDPVFEEKINSYGDFILCTLHRAENTDDLERLQSILSGLNRIHPETTIVLPLHPRTKKVIERNGLELNVETIDPVGYLEMVQLLKKCRLVLTDSGGLQKEAYFFGKNCVTMRDQTEWTELIRAGVNVLVGANRDKILEEVKRMLAQKGDFSVDLYGGGKAGEKIVGHMKK